ncbi:MAG: patatin-like phospholipase family protein [Candidatus Rokubacteria bacterium]|nr:patatin-like phospholipase family protein [Candidatus Rokubacteria bacterium]
MAPAVILVAALVTSLAIPAAALARCMGGRAAPDAPTALVFSGGGAKGAYEAAVATTLIRHRVAVRLVAGTSAGALNAAMVAAAVAEDRIEAVDELWGSMRREQVYGIRPAPVAAGLLPGFFTLMVLDRTGALLDPEPLRKLIRARLDLGRVRTSPVAVVVLATDLRRREARRFDNQSLTVDALMAASSLPGAFPPVEMDGAVLVDGGLVGRAPVLEALEGGPRVARTLVIMSYAPAEQAEPPRTLRRVIEEAFETTMVHQIRRDTELARLRHPEIDIHLLAPSAPLALRPLGFDAEGIRRAQALGRADAVACLAAWRGQTRAARPAQ